MSIWRMQYCKLHARFQRWDRGLEDYGSEDCGLEDCGSEDYGLDDYGLGHYRLDDYRLGIIGRIFVICGGEG